jgi:hypothetical protein
VVAALPNPVGLSLGCFLGKDMVSSGDKGNIWLMGVSSRRFLTTVPRTIATAENFSVYLCPICFSIPQFSVIWYHCPALKDKHQSLKTT